jgi:hypothetical protein
LRSSDSGASFHVSLASMMRLQSAGGTYNYAVVSDEIVRRTKRVASTCGEFDVGNPSSRSSPGSAGSTPENWIARASASVYIVVVGEDIVCRLAVCRSISVEQLKVQSGAQ